MMRTFVRLYGQIAHGAANAADNQIERQVSAAPLPESSIPKITVEMVSLFAAWCFENTCLAEGTYGCF
jgi:hypothetical protein